MPRGIWVWPPDPRGQRRVLRRVADSPHLVAALAAIMKSKEGTSNAELAEAIKDTSEWTTLWVIRQLTALGFIEFKVDFFGNPARYQMTDQGRAAFSAVTGQPLPKPAVPAQPAPQQTVKAPTPATPQRAPPKAA